MGIDLATPERLISGARSQRFTRRRRLTLSASSIVLCCVATAAFAQAASPAPTPPAAPGSATQDTGAQPASPADAAQASSGTAIQDIVVTAGRTESRLQDTPIAVTAVSQDTIASRLVVQVNDLPRVAAGVTVSAINGANRIFIRGIGLTSLSLGQESSIAFNLDGVPIGRPSATLSSFFDLDHIEALKGPQGTLYGRNATGGAINVFTKRPTHDLDGYAQAIIGNYGLHQFDAAVGGPLNASGSIRARIAGQTIDRDGYGRNVTLNEDIDDQHRRSIRGSLAIDLTSKLTALVTGDYSTEQDHDYAQIGFGQARGTVPLLGVVLGGRTIVGQQDIASDVQARNRRTGYGFMGNIDYRLSDSVDLKSITAYRFFKRFNQYDNDITSYPVSGTGNAHETSRQFSEDLQLTYTSHRLHGVAGLFYYDETLNAGQMIPFLYQGTSLGFPTAQFTPQGQGNIRAYAAYGQFSFELFPRLNLTAGLRYSDEHRNSAGTLTTFNFSPTAPRNNVIPITWDRSWGAVTPKFGIDFKPTDDVLLYASATKGFKSGVVFYGSTNPPVNPEFVWAYEAGVKSTWLDRHLTANFGGFYYNYTDLQVSQVIGPASVSTNAAKATIWGLEGTVVVIPATGLNLHTDVAYLNAKFDQFITTNAAFPELGVVNLVGNSLPDAPTWTVQAGAEYSAPLSSGADVTVRADLSYHSRNYFSEFNVNNVSAPPNTTLDMSTEYRTASKKLTIALFMNNVTNVQVASLIVVGSGPYGLPLSGNLIAPRTFGARVRVNF